MRTPSKLKPTGLVLAVRQSSRRMCTGVCVCGWVGSCCMCPRCRSLHANCRFEHVSPHVFKPSPPSMTYLATCLHARSLCAPPRLEDIPRMHSQRISSVFCCYGQLAIQQQQQRPRAKFGDFKLSGKDLRRGEASLMVRSIGREGGHPLTVSCRSLGKVNTNVDESRQRYIGEALRTPTTADTFDDECRRCPVYRRFLTTKRLSAESPHFPALPCGCCKSHSHTCSAWCFE